MSSLYPVAAFTFVLSFAVSARAAGSNPIEEAAIRKQITASDANSNKEHTMPDFIFWSGAYKKPIISHDDPKQYRDGEASITNRKQSTEKIVTVPQRIIVSDSKDLAYEYSTFTLEFDTKTGKHVKVGGAALRVWQKQNGEWKEAAAFMRPYEE
jgi:ketosteroid isomerase-like protein